MKVGGKRKYFWRAIDDEGQVLDVLGKNSRNKSAALHFLSQQLKHGGVHPEAIVTDGLGQYRATAWTLSLSTDLRSGLRTLRHGDASSAAKVAARSKGRGSIEDLTNLRVIACSIISRYRVRPR